MRKKSMVMLFVIFFISFFAFSLKVKADCEPSCPYTNCTQECSGDDGSCWDFLWKAWHQNPDSIFTTHYDACSLDGADLVKKECTETGNEQDVTLNCTLTCMEGGGVEGVALCCEDYGGAVDTVDCGSTIEGDVDNDGDVDCMD
ncbi:MAG: hypothetical protein U9O94_07430, partial [Nanoarchaeota archaeon]|nr:hypothetical protein [Nanoarchaeota archaeon]